MHETLERLRIEIMTLDNARQELRAAFNVEPAEAVITRMIERKYREMNVLANVEAVG